MSSNVYVSSLAPFPPQVEWSRADQNTTTEAHIRDERLTVLLALFFSWLLLFYNIERNEILPVCPARVDGVITCAFNTQSVCPQTLTIGLRSTEVCSSRPVQFSSWRSKTCNLRGWRIRKAPSTLDNSYFRPAPREFAETLSLSPEIARLSGDSDERL